MKRYWEGAYADAESLQTDVMRFMAILGFCLMAILALVRNVDSLPSAEPARPRTEPLPDEAAQADAMARVAETMPPVEQSPAAVTIPEVAPAPKLAEAPVARTMEAPVAEAAPPPEPTPVPGASQRAASARTPSEPATKPAAPPKALPRPTPPPVIAAPPKPSRTPVTMPPPTEPTPAPADEPVPDALVLRFASEADFLKLVSAGTIQVFAYDAATVLELRPQLSFAPARRPRQVRELLEDTIPPLVRTALARADAGKRSFAWGVRLPADLESRIAQHLEKEHTGTLLIDRHGSVRHVPAA